LLFIFHIVFVFEAVQTECLTDGIIEIELFPCLSRRHMGSGGIAPQILTSVLVVGEWSASFSDETRPWCICFYIIVAYHKLNFVKPQML